MFEDRKQSPDQRDILTRNIKKPKIEDYQTCG